MTFSVKLQKVELIKGSKVLLGGTAAQREIDKCTIGQPKFFWDFRLKLHSEVWAKSCLDTNFQPIRKSFDHVTEAPKVLG